LEPSKQDQSSDTEAIPAEVTPFPHREQEAALALRRLGIKIHQVGATISASAPERLWERLFNVSFEPPKIQETEDPGQIDKRRFKRANPDLMSLPEQLDGLVSEVSFQEPPDFFDS
jgi:hypothetical protein